MQTMAVSLSRTGPDCKFNPDFVARCTPAETAAVIQHEVEHVVRQHCVRLNQADAHLANVACDMVVNGHASDPSIGIPDADGRKQVPMRDSIVWMPERWDANMTSEQCYDRLIQKLPNRWRGRLPELMDDHGLWGAAQSTRDNARHAASVLVNAAERGGCESPPGLQRAINALRSGTLNWKRALRDFIALTCESRRVTASRRSRRIDIFGMPGHLRRPSQYRLAVIVDVSGSISDSVLKSFFEEMESLLQHAKFCVLCWDTHLRLFIPRYHRGQWKELSQVGGGGTDMESPVQWLIDQRETGDGIVMLTDGWCQWPQPRSLPFLVICSSPQEVIHVPSWGNIVHLHPDT